MPSGHWTNVPLVNVIEELKLPVLPLPSVVQVPPSLPPEQSVYSPIVAATWKVRLQPSVNGAVRM